MDSHEMCGRTQCFARSSACTAEAAEQCGIIHFIRNNLPGIKAAYEKILREEGEMRHGDPRIPEPKNMRRILTTTEWDDTFEKPLNKFLVARVPPRAPRS